MLPPASLLSWATQHRVWVRSGATSPLLKLSSLRKIVTLHDGSDEEDEQIRVLHFAVSVPDFALEHLTIVQRLPATVDEALLSVHAERQRTQDRAFPRLLPARPQPCPGSGFVLALLNWPLPDGMCAMCINAAGLDGRAQ